MKRHRLSVEATPKLSLSSNDVVIDDFDGLTFSCCQYDEGPVGLTYIKFGPNKAKCHMDIRGGWPSTLNNLSTNGKQMLEGICIAGGSGLGLEAVTGIISECWKHERKIADINGAVIFSKNLEQPNCLYPDKRLGQFAYHHLSNILYSGQVGAGCSASKGQGVVYREIDGIKILVLVVNNAMGNIYLDGQAVTSIDLSNNKPEIGKQTTITIVITDLELDGDELRQLAHQVHSSMAVYIRPFNTFMDGDVFFACSTGSKKKPQDFTDSYLLSNFYCEISDVVGDAIMKSIGH